MTSSSRWASLSAGERRRVAESVLPQVRSDPSRVRNLCVLAHVDHGKTTLSDGLIASNGLIPVRSAGQLRYLDSREDEQDRCITMKSSAIALLHVQDDGDPPSSTNSVVSGMNEHAAEDHAAAAGPAYYAMNLIDSPGHIDFCSEVGAAVRICDGALAVVDVVEGVCVQTQAVLRQAWKERLQVCLVLNKVDRLAIDLRMTPGEACSRLEAILNEVNSLVDTFASEEWMEKLDQEDAVEDGVVPEGGEEDLSGASPDVTFSPVKGNVAFASGFDGWAFRTEDFAKMYAAKLGFSEAALRKCLWGDFRFVPKTKTIERRVRSGNSKAGQHDNMFVQFILSSLWKVYHAIFPEAGAAPDMAGLAKMCKGLGLDKVHDRDLAHADGHATAKAVLSAWLPLGEGLLRMAVAHLPSAKQAQTYRMQHLMPLSEFLARPTSLDDADADDIRQRAKRAYDACASCEGHGGGGPEEVPTVAYVAKMFALSEAQGEAWRAQNSSAGEVGEEFMGFARVFSGRLTVGDAVAVLSPLHDALTGPPLDGSKPTSHAATVTSLCVMMGSGLEHVDYVDAGMVCAIGGLSKYILNHATVVSGGACYASSNGVPACVPLCPMEFQTRPIVRVAVEAMQPAHYARLEAGLRLLNQADAIIDISLRPTGEHVLGVAGEVHLERCLKDLADRFAPGVELKVSPPLIEFRETCGLEGPADPDDRASLEASSAKGLAQADIGKVDRGISYATFDRVQRGAECRVPDGRVAVRAHCCRIPEPLAACLEAQIALRRLLLPAEEEPGSDVSLGQVALDAVQELLDAHRHEDLDTLLGELRRKALEEVEEEWDAGVADWWAREMGRASPLRGIGPNLLVLGRPTDTVARKLSALNLVDRASLAEENRRLDPLPDLSWADSDAERLAYKESLLKGVVAGFSMACQEGPMCGEPLRGVLVWVEVVEAEVWDEVATPEPPSVSVLGGQIIGVVKEVCRQALLQARPRLAEGLYRCEIQVIADEMGGTMGKVYGILSRRRVQVLDEAMKEGTNTFSLDCLLPVADSFGFAGELRQGTSGQAALPQLVFARWGALVNDDPFFVPTTEEEREEFGESYTGADSLSRQLIDSVRARKGLSVQRQVVKDGTKQRTRARKR